MTEPNTTEPAISDEEAQAAALAAQERVQELNAEVQAAYTTYTTIKTSKDPALKDRRKALYALGAIAVRHINFYSCAPLTL